MLFWNADATARIVRVVVAADVAADRALVRFEPDVWGARRIGRLTPDGYHLIAAPDVGTRHHLLLPGPERLEAARAFWHFAARPRVSPAPRSPPARPHSRSLKIAYMAWALDLVGAGASERDIHRAVIGEPPTPWEDSGARSRIRSLLGAAQRWRDGAVFRLLMPQRRSLAG